MIDKLEVSPHNMSSCSPLIVDDSLFVCTSNGVDESHANIPAPRAPSFIAMNRHTGNVLWTDNSPGTNILHAQWASPSYGVFEGQPQVFFSGGDGWLYSFDPDGDGQGHSKLLWKFDCNPKTARYSLRGRSDRNHMIGFSGVYEGLVYIAVGEDPEHGEGIGHLWCLDPTVKQDGSDVSSELAVDAEGRILPQRRYQAVSIKAGERAIPNPDSAAVWHFTGTDVNGNGKIDYEEEMHRSLGTAAIQDDILYIPDFSGVFHCLNAKTGEAYWNFDMFSQCWGSALIVNEKVYIGHEAEMMLVFRHSSDPTIAMPEGGALAEIEMGNAIFMTPVVANGVLFVATKNRLYAIEQDQPVGAP